MSDAVEQALVAQLFIEDMSKLQNALLSASTSTGPSQQLIVAR